MAHALPYRTVRANFADTDSTYLPVEATLNKSAELMRCHNTMMHKRNSHPKRTSHRGPSGDERRKPGAHGAAQHQNCYQNDAKETRSLGGRAP